MENNPIQVPRDNNIGNKKVTKDIETYLLDLFSKNEEEAYSYKELKELVERRFRSLYGDDLKTHVNWAVDMLHYNNLIKRVAPGTFESIDGPDEVYTERETGHSPEGEYSNRGKNVKGIVKVGSRSEFNKELGKCIISVRMLKNLGHTEEQITSELPPDRFNPVAVKLAIKHVFGGVQIDTSEPKKNE